MKISIFLLIIISLLLAPFFVSAQCYNYGTTVVFINGMFTSDQKYAKIDKDKLAYLYGRYGAEKDVTFLNGYNPSHIAGLGDLVNVTTQAYSGGYLDYDLTNILRQLKEDVRTQKIVLVGHSQGSFYTNAAYYYLINNGVDEKSIAVYNVGTPADKVAGNGTYLTSSTDKVINSITRELTLMSFARTPLSANIDIKLSEEESSSPVGGHAFGNVYLASAPDRIISDLDKAISGLEASDSEKQECFVEPKTGMAYLIQDVGYKNIDTAITYFGETTTSPFKSVEQAAAIADSFIKKIAELGGAFASKLGNYIAGLNPAIFITSMLPGYTIEESGEPGSQQTVTLINQSQDENQPTQDTIVYEGSGGPTINPMTDQERQDLLDNIQERLDIISQQVQELIAEYGGTNTQGEEDDPNNPQNENVLTDNNDNNGIVGGGSSNYPKILISEVQIAGESDLTQEFVELYNPNDTEVSLTDWYLQRKTAGSSSWSTYASKNLFSGKKIPANGYFLIARAGHYQTLADIFVDSSISGDNSFALKSPDGDISDKVGFGNAADPELLATSNPGQDQTVGRKVLALSDVSFTEEDTDNNLNDFELQNPTAKSKNIKYTPQPEDDKLDKTAPTVIFSIDAIQAKSDFAIDFSINDPLDVVSPSGIDSYVFRWMEEGESWNEDASQKVIGSPLTYEGKRDFSGEDGKTYNFQIKTEDVAGNESDWQPETPFVVEVDVPKKILINEIQIDSIDGPGGTDDDWVELYNPNEVDVSLDEWSMQKFSSADPCSLEKGYYKKNFVEGSVIEAHSYFLLVGTKANEALRGMADMEVGWSLSDNNTVYLVRDQEKITGSSDSEIVDRVGFGASSCFAETLAAPTPPDSKSIERKISGQDTDNNFNDFKISFEPTPRSGSPKVLLQDATDYRNCVGGGTPGTTVYDLNIKWSSQNPDVDFYQVQYKLNDESWKSWIEKTTDTEKKFQVPYSLLEDKIYNFRVRAVDKSGNFGGWSEIIVDMSNPVVINEASFFGTGPEDLVKDQWIELYNKSDNTIDLTDWEITSSGGFNVTLRGEITAKSFFLLENDQSDTSIKADQIYSGNFGTDELKLLQKNNRLVDNVYIPRRGWPQEALVKEGKYYSLERVSPYSFGDGDKNWIVNNGTTINGSNRNGDPIYGTPNSQNSNYQLYTYIYSSFVEDSLLPKALSPYLFSGDNVHVFKDTTLTIEPGTVIKFFDNNSSFNIKGTIKAIGSEANKIVFTSFKDDECGVAPACGDTNADGSSSAPEPSNWLGIIFGADSINSELENVIVRYGGGFNWSWDNPGSAIKVLHSSIKLKDSIIENNGNKGLWLINSNSIVDNVKFLNQNKAESPNTSIAITLNGGNPVISNSYFYNNIQGIFINDWYDEAERKSRPCTAVIENNNFESNEKPITFDGIVSLPEFSGNKAEGNKYDGIFLVTTFDRDLTLGSDLPYIIGLSNRQIPATRTLTLNPGVILEFNDMTGLEIAGTLRAIGTQENPIIFKQFDDNDTDPASWLGLYFTKNSINSELDNVQIKNAGAFYFGTAYGTGVKIEHTKVSIRNSLIENNKNSGIWMINSDSIIDNVQFVDNNSADGGRLKASGAYIQGGRPEINNSLFKHNYYGIVIDEWTDEEGNEIEPELKGENNVFEENLDVNLYDLTGI